MKVKRQSQSVNKIERGASEGTLRQKLVIQQ